MSGKGDSPRNIGPKFKENFDFIDWRKAPKMVVGHIYRYIERPYKMEPRPEILVRYLGLCDLKGCLYHQMEHYPESNKGGIYLDNSEIKNLKDYE